MTTALGHVNHARDLGDAPATVRCELYFKALNALWNEFGRSHQLDGGDTKLLTKLTQSLPPERGAAVLRSSTTRSIIALDPPVMNDDVLRRRGYRPSTALSESLRAEATEKHVELIRRHGTWRAAAVEPARVLKTLAEFLYVVRSNIAHGEKTPYGPDLEKARRDEQVASAVVPVQEVLIDELLDHPAEKLAAYGTLRPGEANARVLDGIVGAWLDCSLTGHCAVGTSGFAEFKWDVRGERVAAKMLRSSSLPHHWDRLDAFEGSGYARYLVPVEVGGAAVVANCYIAR